MRGMRRTRFADTTGPARTAGILAAGYLALAVALVATGAGCSGEEGRTGNADADRGAPGRSSGPDAAADAATSADGAVLADPSVTPPPFAEVAGQLGIDFVHNTGAFGLKWLPETMGSGCAWVDIDSDGDSDLLLLSGKDFPGHSTGRRQTVALYRNDGGRFTDISMQAGLNSPLYAMGVTYGDYDNDGDADLYITALGPNRLYRNDGGTFTDVAEAMGVADPGFGSSAAWFDFDKDADLDLFTLNYVSWTPETDVYCSLDGTNKSYCTPEVYNGAAPRLYRNDGSAFTDVTEAAGVGDPTAKALGIVCFDFDGDGWEDVFVANDTQPNFLFRNRGDGTFEEQGVMAGVAFDEAGRARGAMGVDIADYDNSGRPSLAIGNFSNEMLALFHNEGAGFFIDAAPTSAVGRQSLLTLAFGTVFMDVDLDGFLDLFVGNGHVEDEIQKVQERVSYAQPPHLFRNLGGGRFDDIAPRIPAFETPIVARGTAVADFDQDGDLDIAVVTSGGAARLYRNDGEQGARALRLRLEGGAGSNRDGIGARVLVEAGGWKQTQWKRSAHSYASQSESALTFGLGSHAQADRVIVTWPSGKVSVVESAATGQLLVVREADAR